MNGFAPIVILAVALGPLGGEAHRRTEDGNRLYAEGAWDDALRAYTEAQVAAPDAPELLYDIGNVLYRKEDWVGAEEAYARALAAAPPELAADAAYNRGNALFRQERFGDAASSYRRALEFRPDDPDAKRNLEIALAHAEEQRRQERQPRPEESEGDAGSSEAAPPEEAGGEPEEPRTDRDEPEPGDRQGPPPASEDGAMTREEAERLLDGVAGEERERLRRRLAEERRTGDASPREKDW